MNDEQVLIDENLDPPNKKKKIDKCITDKIDVQNEFLSESEGKSVMKQKKGIYKRLIRMFSKITAKTHNRYERLQEDADFGSFELGTKTVTIDQRNREVDELRDVITSLRCENERLTELLETAGNATEAAARRVAESEAERLRLRDAVDGLEQRNRSLCGENEKLRRRSEAQEGLAIDTGMKMAYLNHELDERAVELEQSLRENDRLSAGVDGLRRELNETRDAVDGLEQRNRSLCGENERLRQQLEVQERLAIETGLKIVSLDRELNERAVELEQSLSENGRLSAGADGLRRELKETRDETTRLKDEMGRRLADAATERDANLRELTDLTGRFDAETHKAAVSEAEQRRLRDAIDGLKRVNGSLSDHVGELRRRYEECWPKMLAMEEELTEGRRTLTEKDSDIAALICKLDIQDGDIKKIRRRIKVASVTETRLRSQLQFLDNIEESWLKRSMKEGLDVNTMSLRKRTFSENKDRI